MDITVHPQALRGTVAAPPSKSQLHRLLICAALAATPTRIRVKTLSYDIQATCRCLWALGASVTRDGDDVLVSPIAHAPREVRLECGESGSTLRFLLPVAAALCPKVICNGARSLRRRPLDGLVQALEAGGVAFVPAGSIGAGGAAEAVAGAGVAIRGGSRNAGPAGVFGAGESVAGVGAESLPLASEGLLQPGAFRIDGSVSSQYVSGMLFAMAALATKRFGLRNGAQTGGQNGMQAGELSGAQANASICAGECSNACLPASSCIQAPDAVELRVEGQAVSQPYATMTLEALRSFGLRIDDLPDGCGWSIPLGQRMEAPGVLEPEGDWSNAAVFEALRVCEPGVEIEGLRTDSLQGDRAIARMAQRWRADVAAGRDALCDIADTPDLFPVLAVMAAAPSAPCSAQRTTTFTKVNRLRMKESDRLLSMANLLSTLGVRVRCEDDACIIESLPAAPALDASAGFNADAAPGIATVPGEPVEPVRVSAAGDHRIVMAALLAAHVFGRTVTVEDAQSAAKSYPDLFDAYRLLGGDAVESAVTRETMAEGGAPVVEEIPQKAEVAFTVQLAGLTIGIRALFPQTRDFMRDFVCEDGIADAGELAFTIEMTPADMDLEHASVARQYRLECERYAKDPAAPQPVDPARYSEHYLETLALHRRVSLALVDYGTVLFHGSAVAVDGCAYLFTAPSGVGKSTHSRMWRQVFGDRAVMVNDDKPFLHITPEGITVYGTPWNGKHHLGMNGSAPLAGLCLFGRGQENVIREVGPAEAFTRLYLQTYRPSEPQYMEKTLALIDTMCHAVPLYEAECLPNEDAARVTYERMSR